MENEQKIFLALYSLWTQPTSAISRNTNIERTTTYKILLRLTEIGIVRKTQKNQVMNFYIPENILKSYIQKQKNIYENLENQYQNIQEELEKSKINSNSNLPKITIFDNLQWIKNIYDDILQTIQANNYPYVKFFASNVFGEQIKTNANFKEIIVDFFEKIKRTDTVVDSFLWNWVLLMENVSKNTQNMSFLENLPAGNSSINIFLVWKTFYLVIFKDYPFGIKIENKEIVQTLHFMIDNLKLA